MDKPMKKKGRPLKEFDPTEDDKTRRNREAQNRYKQKVGKQVGAVVDDLDKCEEERMSLQDKVKGLTKLLKTCDDQVIDIMKTVNDMPKISKKTAAKSASVGVVGKEASKMIQGAIRGKIARNKMKEAEKQRTFDILLR
jgi:seryl-tRNA synthetase